MELCPWRRSLTGALLACLAACTPIQFAEQEITLRHDAAADALEMLIVYDGVHAGAPPPDSNDKVSDLVTEREFALRVAQGERVFMIWGWPLIVDVEEWFADPTTVRRELDAALAEPGIEPDDRLEAELKLWMLETKALSAGFCSGSSSRLSLHQTLRFERVSKLVELAQTAAYLWVEQAAADGSLEREGSVLDARTRALWIQGAKERRKWLFLAGGVLTVELPMSEASAARLLAMSLGLSTEPDGFFLAGLLSHPDTLRVADERVVLTWKLDHPVLTFVDPRRDEYTGRLATALRASGEFPKEIPARSDIEDRFHSRRPESR